jgi:hypothetical protein
VASARKRSTAVAQWGWSGVEELRTPALPDDKVTQALALLPKQLSPIEEIKIKIQTLGAKYHRYLHQDEFGPTRAQRMSALRLILGTLEQLDTLLLGLPQQLVLDLMNNSARQSLRISHSPFCGVGLLSGSTR